MPFKEIATDAIRYWERRRTLYNAVLAAVTAVAFFTDMQTALEQVSFDLLRSLFLLAVLANMAFCAAYPVDLLAQSSGFREAWRRHRWILLLIGILFAAFLAQGISESLFDVPLGPD
jgi:hypothetical protein